MITQSLLAAMNAELERTHQSYEVMIQDARMVEQGWLVTFVLDPKNKEDRLTRYQRIAYFKMEGKKGLRCPWDYILA